MLAAGCTTTTGGSAPTPAEERQSIEDGVESTMTLLQANVPGSRALLAKASGVLVFPRVIEAGFVVGGEHGHGALRVGGRTRGYYQITGLSLGLQAGAQSKALVIMFLTPAALERFLASNGWTAGADASVAVIRDGANATVDSISAHADVTALALTNSGLMAAAKVDGSKITRLDLSGGRP
jgi:lipid-binding SYLF domain-containing protein